MKRRKKIVLIPVLAALLATCMIGTAFAYISSHYLWSGWFNTIGTGYSNPSIQVRTIQRIYNYDMYLTFSNGGMITEDGIFGTETKNAIKNLQSVRGITVDGICGPNTWQNWQYQMTYTRTDAVGNEIYLLKIDDYSEGGPYRTEPTEELRHLISNGSWQLGDEANNNNNIVWTTIK